MELANLSIAVDSRDVRTAEGDLDRMARTGERTERSVGSVGRAAEGAGRQARTANEAASRSANRLAGAYDRVGGSISTVARRMLALGAATFGVTASLRTLTDFEQSMASVSAITRATTEELQAMRDMAKELGATTEFTASQAADGLKFLGMAGFSAAESIAAIPQVLDLATAAQMDLSRAADISSNMMSAFGIAAKDAAQVTDVLAAAVVRSNTDVSQLGEAMKMVGPVASSMGISINDTAAAIGALSDAGIQGSMAGTGLRRILTSLTNPTAQSANAIRGLGLSIAELNPQTTPVVEIVQKLKDAGIDASAAFKIFGDRGAPALLALVENEPKLRELSEALSDVEGEASTLARIMRDNLAGDFKGAMSAIEGVIISLGEAGLIAVMRGVAQVATTVFRSISALIDGIASVGRVVGDVLAPSFRFVAQYADMAVAAIAGFYAPAVIAGIATLITSVRTLTVAIGTGLVGAIRAVTAAMLANPLGRLVAVMGAAVYGVYKFRDSIQEAVGVDVVGIAKRAANYVIGSFVAAYEDIKFVWNNFGDVMGAAVIRGVNNAIRAINILVRKAAERIDGFIELINKITGVNVSALGGDFGISELDNPYANRLGAALEQRNKAIDEALSKDYIGQLRGETSAMTSAEEAADALAKALEELNNTTNTNTQLTNNATAAAKAFAKEREKALKDHESLIARLHDEAQALEDQVKTFGQGERAIEQLAIARLKDQRAVLSGFDGSEKLLDLLDREIEARERLMSAGLSLDRLEEEKAANDAMLADWKQTVGEYGRVFRDGFAGMLNHGRAGWRSFTKSLITTFKTSVADQIYKMLAQPFIVRIVASLAGVTGAGAAAAGGLGGIGGAATSAGTLFQYGKAAYDMLSGGLNAAKMIGEQAIGLGMKFGSEFGIKFGAGLTSTSSMSSAIAAAKAGGTQLAGLAVGTLANAFAGYSLSRMIGGKYSAGKWVDVVSGIASAIPGIGPIAGVVGGLINRAFGRGPKEYKDTTMVGVFGDDFSGRTETPWKRKGGWFRSSKRGVDVRSLDAGFVDAINEAYAYMRAGVAGLAATVGVSADRLKSYSEQIRITLTSDQKRNQEMVEEAISRVGDNMVRFIVPSIERYAQENETATQTLERLSTALSAANTRLAWIGQKLFDISLSGADAASSLVDVFGGLDNLTAATEAFYRTVYTDGERAAMTIDRVGEALRSVDVTSPLTVSSLRDVALSLDLTTSSGREAFATIVALIPELAEAIDVTERLAREAAQSLIDAFTARGKLVPAMDLTQSKAAGLSNALSDAAAEAGRITSQFLDATSSIYEFSYSAAELDDTISGAQSASILLRDQIHRLRSGAQSAQLDFRGLAEALEGFNTETFVATVAAAFEVLAGRIQGVIDSIASERAAVREGALSIIDPDIMTPAAISRLIASINTGLPSNAAAVAADKALKDADRIAGLRSQSELAKWRQLDSARQAEERALSAVAAAESSYTSARAAANTALRGYQNILKGVDRTSKYRETAEDFSRGIKFRATGYWTYGSQTAANNAAYSAYSKAFDTARARLRDLEKAQQAAAASASEVARLDAIYKEAVKETAEAMRLVDEASERAKKESLKYADALQSFMISATKSVDRLSNLREETLKYYQAQKQLADLMSASAASIRKTVDDYRLGLMGSEQQFARLQDDFARAYSLALSTDGEVLVGYGDELNRLLVPLLDKAQEVLSGTQLDAFINTTLSRAETIAARLEDFAPTNYEQEALDLLGQIDTTLAALEQSAKTADQIIVNAINAGRDATVGGLREILNALTGKPVKAFALGGLHAGGLRLVGERGPELEATGPARIYSASQTRALLSNPKSDDRLVAEVKALREEVANLRIEARATAANTHKLARQATRTEIDGLLVRTERDEPLHVEVIE